MTAGVWEKYQINSESNVWCCTKELLTNFSAACCALNSLLIHGVRVLSAQDLNGICVTCEPNRKYGRRQQLCCNIKNLFRNSEA